MMPSQLFREITQDLSEIELQKIALRLDISRTTLWRRLKDPAAMRLDQAIKLCNCFNINNPKDLLT
jgi:predicted DNA-binding protein (UPF0251 family)